MPLYLLQSGTQANFDINPSTMPLENLLVISIFALVAIAMVLFVIVRYVRKIGSIDLGKEHTSESFIYNMNLENQEHDNQLRIKIRMITSTLGTRLTNIFHEYKACPVTSIALSNIVRNPLYTAANNNHFTTVMLPENREAYIEGLLRSIEDEYKMVHHAIIDANCEKENPIPKWDESDDKDSIRNKIRIFLMGWAHEVTTETIKTCLRKIEVYKKYEPEFKHDSYRSGIVVSRIAKNEKYVSLLDRHGNVNWK